MLYLLAHWGPLAFLIAAPIAGAVNNEVRRYRREGERISITAG
jgi:hypothetical protein